MKYILFLIIFLIPYSATAQMWYPAPPYSGTVAGNYFIGQGFRAMGRGEFLKGLGQYQIDNQESNRLFLENRNIEIDLQQRLRSINQADFDAVHPNLLIQKTKQLDTIEKQYALREREDRMIREGKIPSRAEPSMVIRGQKYKNVAEWAASKDYHLFLLEKQQKDLEDKIKDLRDEEFRRDGIAFLRNWDHMPSNERNIQLQHEQMLRDGYDRDGSGKKIDIHAKHGNYPELEDQIKIYREMLLSVFRQEDALRASK